MSEPKRGTLQCAETWTRKVKGIWHVKHRCKYRVRVTVMSHPGPHRCTCGDIK